MEFKDYYTTLGIERSATDNEIKKAYRRLARKFHPDVSKEPQAEVRFKEMKEAYEVLKDADKRAAYDKFGENWEAGQDFSPPPGWDQNYRPSHEGYGRQGAGTEDFSDFFDTLFGGGRGGFARQGFGDARFNGQDTNAQISIAIEDAYRGATRTLTMEVQDVDDRGQVSRKQRTLNVTIPKGVKAGQRIRLAGQGSPGVGEGTSAGDLYLKVDYEKHALFEARGRDIYVTLPLTPAEAALGATITTPTLGGSVELKVPPGSCSGKRLRLKGRGLPGSAAGDQYVELEIIVPKVSGPKSSALYEQLRDAEREEGFNPRADIEAAA